MDVRELIEMLQQFDPTLSVEINSASNEYTDMPARIVRFVEGSTWQNGQDAPPYVLIECFTQ